MSTVQRFEDLIAWQKARELTKAIYVVTRANAFAKDFRLSSQIQSAAVSVMSNIAEGFERSSLKEFFQFLSIAKSSSAEVRSQLYVALDVNYLEKGTFQKLMQQSYEVAKIIGGLRSSIGNRIKLNTPRMR